VSNPRRLIVEVRSGMRRGEKAVVDPGAVLRIGRTDRADLILPLDAHLSGVHCALSWDGAVCRLRDLGSARGTELGGERVEGEAPVPHGGWIKAGETSFSVYVEAHTPPRAPPLADPATSKRAAQALAPRVGRLYAVLDAARDDRVLELLHESVDEARSLYDGVKGEALAEVAPYLCALRSGSGLLDRLLREGWGRSFGVFVESGAPFNALRRHLRRFLLVEKDESGGRMYFRFYDPRVLREFLPLATVRQRDVLFADVVDAFLCEDEAGELLAFAASARGARSGREESHAPDP
jgi:hypothetical protein